MSYHVYHDRLATPYYGDLCSPPQANFLVFRKAPFRISIQISNKSGVHSYLQKHRNLLKTNLPKPTFQKPTFQNLPSKNLPSKTYLPKSPAENLPSTKPTSQKPPFHQTYLPQKPTYQKTYIPPTISKKTYLPWKGGLEVNLPSSFTLF